MLKQLADLGFGPVQELVPVISSTLTPTISRCVKASSRRVAADGDAGGAAASRRRLGGGNRR